MRYADPRLITMPTKKPPPNFLLTKAANRKPEPSWDRAPEWTKIAAAPAGKNRSSDTLRKMYSGAVPSEHGTYRILDELGMATKEANVGDYVSDTHEGVDCGPARDESAGPTAREEGRAAWWERARRHSRVLPEIEFQWPGPAGYRTGPTAPVMSGAAKAATKVLVLARQHTHNCPMLRLDNRRNDSRSRARCGRLPAFQAVRMEFEGLIWSLFPGIWMHSSRWLLLNDLDFRAIRKIATIHARGRAHMNSSRQSLNFQRSRAKQIAFFSIMLLLILLSVEAASQVLFAVRYGRFVWASEQERFNVRSFTRLVDDARHVTTIPDFTDSQYEGWGVSIDSWGFRRGTHATNPTCPNVVFIGDSVPFGWGVPDSATMPSKVFDRMRREGDSRCVINAAIPSYSLFQAVARFEREIVGKIKIDVVYLQIFDPVTQLMLLGPYWKPDVDWTTQSSFFKHEEEFPLFRYSASAAIIQNALYHFGWQTRFDTRFDTAEIFTPADRDTTARFRLAVRRELDHVHALTVRGGARELILAPLTMRSYRNIPAERRFAIEALNDELRQFASTHSDTIYFDTIKLLEKEPESKVFVDNCCHLSERGNDVVAEHLVQLLDKTRSK
jgi:hypothetical protein